MKTCVIGVSRDAHHIIDYWIDYYLNLGFNHIFLFDNNDIDNKYNINNNNVTVIPYHGYPMYEHFPEWRQVHVYKIGLMMAQDQGYNYALICDDDEFLDFKNHYNNVNEFLNKYSSYDNIIMSLENIGDNGYIYIKDEPEYKNLNDIYTKPNGNTNFEKSFYKIPNIDKFRKVISECTPFLMHFVSKDNSIKINLNDTSMKHYITYCMERYLIKKTKYKGYIFCMTDKLLKYYLNENECTDEKLNAFVELCKKHNITLSESDKEILNSHNIKY